jgi:hypothetical protein
MIKKILLLLFAAILVLNCSPLHAQSITIDNSEYRQKVLKYLASDYFITEGVGIKRVYIGQGQAQMLKSLGKPLKTEKPGILSNDRNYYFKLDNETDLQVGVKDRLVQAIAFSGPVSSQFTTVKGARFAMSPYEILNLYGRTAVDEQSLIYKKLGVRFDFENSRLKIIRIFRPQK